MEKPVRLRFAAGSGLPKRGMRCTSSESAEKSERSSSCDSDGPSSAESRLIRDVGCGCPRGGGGDGALAGASRSIASRSISSSRSSPSGRSSSIGPPPCTRSGPSRSRSMKSSRATGRSCCPLGIGRSESSEIGSGSFDSVLGLGSSASVSAMGRSTSSSIGSMACARAALIRAGKSEPEDPRPRRGVGRSVLDGLVRGAGRSVPPGPSKGAGKSMSANGSKSECSA